MKECFSLLYRKLEGSLVNFWVARHLGEIRLPVPSRNRDRRQIHIGPPPFLQIAPGANISDSADVTMIGVAGDFRNASLAHPPEPQITVLYAQHPLVNYGFKDIVIRTASDPRLLVPEIRNQLHELDPDMPFAEVQTMDEVVEAQTGGQR